MHSYQFSVSRRHGAKLGGVVPGELVVDTMALALQTVHPDLPPGKVEWLRGAVEKFLVEEQTKVTFPVLMVLDDEARCLAAATVWRVAELSVVAATATEEAPTVEAGEQLVEAADR